MALRARPCPLVERVAGCVGVLGATASLGDLGLERRQLGVELRLGRRGRLELAGSALSQLLGPHELVFARRELVVERFDLGDRRSELGGGYVGHVVVVGLFASADGNAAVRSSNLPSTAASGPASAARCALASSRAAAVAPTETALSRIAPRGDVTVVGDHHEVVQRAVDCLGARMVRDCHVTQLHVEERPGPGGGRGRARAPSAAVRRRRHR